MTESSDESAEIAAEQARVSAMYDRLDAEIAATRAELAEIIGTPPADPADAFVRDATAARLTRNLRGLEAAESALCFGRIDHLDGSMLYIGRRGLRADDGAAPLLVDWRAHAARAFYTATPVDPAGLRRRRHLRLDGRSVRGVSDEILDGSPPRPDDVVGDGPLAEALAAKRTGRMRAAVTTLQAEQDAIVRSPHRGVTVVQGGPGTGKTVVALHRAAYVLYAFPRAAEDGVLVVGPNQRFLDYISQVLPSLGENDVVLTTRDDLAGIEPDAPADPAEVARLKGRIELADALASYVRARRSTVAPIVVPVGSERIQLDESEIVAARVRAEASGLAHNAARGRFKADVVAGLADALERRVADALERIDADVAAMTGLDLDKAAAADLLSLGFDGPAEDLGEELDPEAVRAALAADELVERAVEALWPRLDPLDVVRGLLGDPAALDEHLAAFDPAERRRLLRLADAAFTASDVPLIDEATALVVGAPERVYGHVVVDEAQELTELDWRLVMRRCPVRSMTVVGDFAQAGPISTVHTWSDALGPHVDTRFELHTLTVNYRTTAAILDATRELLAAIAPEQSVSRSVRPGEPPRTLTVAAAELVDAVTAELTRQAAAYPGELLAVICTDRLAAELAGPVGGRATVVPAAQARGLEFDSVLVVGPAEIVATRSSGQRDLYVALTRATRRLCTVDVRPLSASGR